MYYIRLLRPAKLDPSSPDRRNPPSPCLSLLITITTDLGDAFLCPPDDEPFELVVAVQGRRDPSLLHHGSDECQEQDGGGSQTDESHGPTSLLLEPERRYTWRAGMRVLDLKLRLQPYLLKRKEDLNCTVSIHPAAQKPPLGDLHTADLVPRQSTDVTRTNFTANKSRGVVVPANVEIVNGICAPVSKRRLRLGEDVALEFGEDIGESIARHVWDAGVVAAALLGYTCRSRDAESSIIHHILARAAEREMKDDKFNVLELGTGVGILGLSIAAILPFAFATQKMPLRLWPAATVLLTDLPEAEERARANIASARDTISSLSWYRQRVEDNTASPPPPPPVPRIEYENLDWDEGSHGRFGPLTRSTAWDLVVLSDCTYNVDSLPALVGTLSALHTVNENLRPARERKTEEIEESGQKERNKKRKRGSIGGGDGVSIKSTVLLATKPRHESEEALFVLLKAEGWRYRVLQSVPLLKIGEEDEVVEVYILEKGGSEG
ncbi:Uu.00g144400.m01.CDS01 [Anthostomella pinea]|uniref:Uu.00g144400.m01.CDS01 n=1 Tax=Anthostomella pinea TaxID=933095 RepID=A0AAI8VRI0_9PEZI|nr:Uu.00g144400.m01.CDS01 [Anthostomella pinea]